MQLYLGVTLQKFYELKIAEFEVGQWRDVRSVQVWLIPLQSDWSMLLPPSGAYDKTGCQLESTLPRPPMESLDSSCTKLKAAYDTCFNAWFRDRFLKGHSDHDGTCGQLFEIYQQCLTVSHNRAPQWLVFSFFLLCTEGNWEEEFKHIGSQWRLTWHW